VKARGFALLALAAGAVAGVVWWRRRRERPARAAVQIGLTDGSVRTLDPTDPATAELQALAAGVRDSSTGGA
jgi:Mg-chelatase subunit ChlD